MAANVAAALPVAATARPTPLPLPLPPPLPAVPIHVGLPVRFAVPSGCGSPATAGAIVGHLEWPSPALLSRLSSEPSLSRHTLLDRRRRAALKVQLHRLAQVLQPYDPDSKLLATDVDVPAAAGAQAPPQVPPLLTAQADVMAAAIDKIQQLRLEIEHLKQRIHATSLNTVRSSTAPGFTANSAHCHPAQEVLVSAAPPATAILSRRSRDADLFHSLAFAASGICGLKIGAGDAVLECSELYPFTVGHLRQCIVGSCMTATPLHLQLFLLPPEMELHLGGRQAEALATADAGVISVSAERAFARLFAISSIANASILDEHKLTPLSPMVRATPTVRTPDLAEPHGADLSASLPSTYCDRPTEAHCFPTTPLPLTCFSPSNYFRGSPTLSPVSAHLSVPATPPLTRHSEGVTPLHESHTADERSPHSLVLASSAPPGLTAYSDVANASGGARCAPVAAACNSGDTLHAALHALLAMHPEPGVVRLLARQPTSWGEVLESVLTIGYAEEDEEPVEALTHARTDHAPACPLLLLATANTRRLLAVSSETQARAQRRPMKSV